MAIRLIPAAAPSPYTPPSTPPKRKGIDLDQLANEGLHIALSAIPAAAAASSTPPSTPPKRKYSGLQPLASGGMGEVRQGKSVLLSPVACKVTSFMHAKHESHILNELFFHRTPHSLRCRDLCDPKTFQAQENSSPEALAMLVTDLIPAKDLHYAFLSSSVPLENRLKSDEIITIFKSLLQYLAKLYSLKIIHRDLKPRNLIYHQPSRHLTVIDPALAVNLKKVFEKQPSGQTPAYQSPEWILGNPLSLSIDLWSAGCILFEMLTDQQLIPFDYKTPRDQQNNHLLQMIAARIGTPSPEYLKSLSESQKYFDEPLTQFTHPLNIQLERWEKVFDAAAEQKKFSAVDKAAWKSILSQLLTYTQRASAAELLLQGGILKQDTCFHLSLNNPQVEEIRVVRLSQVPAKLSEKFSAADISTPDLIIHRKQLVNQHCFHIPRDPHDQYLIYLKETTNSETVHQIKLQDNCLVKIDDEGAEVSYPLDLQTPPEGKKPRVIPFPQIPDSPEASPLGFPNADQYESDDSCAPTQPDIA